MSLLKTLLISITWDLVFFGGMLFVPAGTIFWWRAWVFLAVVLAGTVWTITGFFPGREDLLRERFKPPIQKGQPIEDKILITLFIALFCGLIVFIPLDVFHLHLIYRPGAFVSAWGLPLLTCGWWIMSLSMKENAFAASVVRYQKERNHIVVDTGIYGIIRHPMYLGGILLMAGMPLWLESYAAVLLAIVPGTLLILRIFIEERFLKRELKGYEDYMRRVRHRLIPLVW